VTGISIPGALLAIDPLTALGVLFATAATDAVYVMFSSAIAARRRLPAATWSSVWYLLSSFAVISYTQNWAYVAFAAAGSWLGAFASMTYLHRPRP
jgi:hypothetical protein